MTEPGAPTRHGEIAETVEQELKFKPPHEVEQEIQAKFTGAHFATANPDELLGLVLGALPLGKYTFTGKKKIRVDDLYLDDDALSLYEAGYSLRVRRVGSAVELTLKTPEGGGGSELVRREATISYSDEAEYEESENSGFTKERDSFRLQCGVLSPVLAISNNRVACTMIHGDERYMLAVDIFTQCEHKTRRTSGPDVEIEIESKTEAARIALPGIGRVLAARLKSEARPESKYARGISQLKITSGWRKRETRATQVENPRASPRVFVVHGHDDVARLELDSFLKAVRLTPVVLATEASGGMTVIEKFERHVDVAFAVVLFTPDDVGYAAAAPEAKRGRARQNVVFELGYFVACLGRGKVAVLVKGDVEILSDYGGVIYVPMDGAGGWRLVLAREMRRAGLELDANLMT